MITSHTQLKQLLAKHPLITGSFLLTLVGFISRLIGFFYRIYMSRVFGEEGMGIYQLISPVMALAFSLTAAGFQTSISKFVAETTHKDSTLKPSVSPKPFYMGLSLSLPLSVFILLILIRFSDILACNWLNEPRTAPLLRILALSIPLSALHACLNGYFYGKKQATVPSICQIIEQCSRVLAVYLTIQFYLAKGSIPPLQITVFGVFIGELFSTLINILFYFGTTKKQKSLCESIPCSLRYGSLLLMVLPLIANRVTLNALLSVETISLPSMLKMYGYDHTTALSVYGVLTGMAFPLIFFPNAVTGSIAVLLLPLISEQTALGNTKEVRKLTRKVIQYCSVLGFACMAVFLLFGNFLGSYLFQSELAGIYITALSYLCPFLYLNNTLSAILQGMGKVITLFFVNVSALLLRLFFLYQFVPVHGMKGYLWGLLAAQIYTCAFYLFVISRKKKLAR